MPDGFIEAAVNLFSRLEDVPLADLPLPPPFWPADGDCAGFAHALLSVTTGVRERFTEEFSEVWSRLGIPDRPFDALWLSELRRRPFRLVHADVHRKNVIAEATGRYVFIDWELALPGDPVYELAVHLHKMDYKR